VLALLPFVLAVWFVRWLVLPPEDRAFLTLRRQLASFIRRRFGGYRHWFNQADCEAELPQQLQSAKRVVVVGAGLAGLGTAALLSDRGFEVTIVDKNSYLGGKVGAWDDTTRDGRQMQVEHGFHAFFRHYYNLNQFLERTGVRQNMKSIDDYMILERDGRAWRFKQFETSPVLNLVALAKGGLYAFRDILFGPALHEMDVFLTYDREQTFLDLDDVSYEEFAERAQLPKTLRLVFNTFARAFFADEDRLSMAELVKSFHFYYLSHDHGLLYDYPDGDYQRTVLSPIERYLRQRNVRLLLGEEVAAIGFDGKRYQVMGEHYDYAVLATTSGAAAMLARNSPDIARHAPRLCEQLSKLRSSQRYAVMRVWIDRPLPDDVPVFVATERDAVLDAVSMVHRISNQAREWAMQHGGAVLELHCYAVPDELVDEAIRDEMLRELEHHFPAICGYRVVHEHLQVRNDFTAFHVGMAASRPATTTELGGLLLAGDWVKLPLPAMLMEAAYTAGLLASNAILSSEGLLPEPVYSVPPRGILGARPRSR